MMPVTTPGPSGEPGALQSSPPWGPDPGSVYWTAATGAWEVRGAIRKRWASLGLERSALGYPTTNEFAVPGGRANDFQGGRITWDAATGRLTVTLR